MSARIINGIFYMPSLKPPPKKPARIIIFPGPKKEKPDAPKTNEHE